MKKENKKGLSLLALMITIIVIVILAAIVINTSVKTPDSAGFSKFASDMGALQDAISISYLDRLNDDNELKDDEIYSEIAGGVEYVGALPQGLGDARKAWKIENVDNINGMDRLPSYGDLYLTDNGTVFLGGTGYEYDGESYIATNIRYAAGESSEVTTEQVNALIARIEILEGQLGVVPTAMSSMMDSKISTNNTNTIPGIVDTRISASGLQGGMSSSDISTLIDSKISTNNTNTIPGIVDTRISASGLQSGMSSSDVSTLIDSKISTNNTNAIPGIVDTKISTNNLNKIYPVGSIFITTAATNPGTYLGGTWVAYGQGRTLIGAGTGTDSNSTLKEFLVNAIGGEYSHTLSTTEIPAHTHPVKDRFEVARWSTAERIMLSDGIVFNNTHPKLGSDYISSVFEDPSDTGPAARFAYSNNDTDFAGGSAAHNNIQPYIVTYMWQRTN